MTILLKLGSLFSPMIDKNRITEVDGLEASDPLIESSRGGGDKKVQKYVLICRFLFKCITGVL